MNRNAMIVRSSLVRERREIRVGMAQSWQSARDASCQDAALAVSKSVKQQSALAAAAPEGDSICSPCGMPEGMP
jgi:hypothetical protein